MTSAFLQPNHRVCQIILLLFLFSGAEIFEEMYEYLVMCVRTTKRMCEEDKDDLITRIIVTFKVGRGACLKLKYFNPEWDCDIDIDEARELPDGNCCA